MSINKTAGEAIFLGSLLVAGWSWAATTCPVSPPGCTSSCTINWTDPTLTQNVTAIKSVHITELRACIDWARGNAGLSRYPWSDPTITAKSTRVRATHVADMRTAISAVCAKNGQGTPHWTDPILTPNTTSVKAVHFQELRNAIGTCNKTSGPDCMKSCNAEGGGWTGGPPSGRCPRGMCPGGCEVIYNGCNCCCTMKPPLACF